MKARIHLCYISMLLLFVFHDRVFSQESKIERVPIDELSDVNAIVKDKQGFIWMGTEHGLYRYDGTHIKLFSYVSNDTTTISDNFIYDLFVDRTGVIWISTNHGLNTLDPITGKINTYFHDENDPHSISHNQPYRITEDPQGNIWIGSKSGLSIFNRFTGAFTVYRHDPLDSLSISAGKIQTIFIDHLHRYWIGTDHGLNLFDPQTSQFHHYFSGRPAPTMDSWIIMEITEDKDGMLWLATWGEGLIRFDPKTLDWVQYWEVPDHKHRGDHNVIFDLETCDFDTNSIYIASSELKFGLFDKRTQTFKSIPSFNQPFPEIEEGQCLYRDDLKNLWFGTKGATFKLSNQNSLFKKMDYSQILGKDCIGNIVSVYEDTLVENQRTLWLGTWTCGLIKAEVGLDNAAVILQGLKRPEMENYFTVTSTLRMDQKTMWFGTNAGILEQNPSGNLVKKFSHNADDTTTLSSNDIHQIFKDRKGNLWIATNNGLNLFEQSQNEFIRFYPSADIPARGLNQNNIQKIIELPSGNLLIQADLRAIYVFDPLSNRFSAFSDSLFNAAGQSGYFYDMLCDSKGNTWVVGSFGVLKITGGNPKSVVETMTTVHGLSYDFATGIAEDDCGRIWITTRQGLNAYDENSNAFQQFFVHDGLFSNNLEGSFTKGSSGNLFISYTNIDRHGILSYFDPCAWESQLSPTPLIISGLKILNQDIDSLINISDAKNITLTHKDRMITFEYALLNYLAPDQNRYAYKLEGFDDDWIYAGSNTTATYTNLDGGKYIFHVKSVSGLSDKMSQEASIALFVKPIFYKTWWFYLTSIVFVSSLLYLIYRIRLAQIQKLNAVRLGISHDLHDDIGSRLSSISIQTQLAEKKIKDPDFNISKSYQQIAKGSQEALELMNDIVWSVNPKYDRLDDTIVRMREYASEILEAKDIDFDINAHASLETFILPMKIRKDFYLVFKEAVNNLAKYSESTQARIFFFKENGLLVMTIEDNGKGFDLNTIKKGNGLNTMQTRARAMRGKMIIQSEVLHGTKVRLEIPVA